MITSTIEIAAPPAKVREIVRTETAGDHSGAGTLTQFRPQLLNFSAYPEWHTEWLKEIKPTDGKRPQDLASGDKIDVNIENFKFVAEVKVRHPCLHEGNKCLSANKGKQRELVLLARPARVYHCWSA
jgi:hypothetical protein